MDPSIPVLRHRINPGYVKRMSALYNRTVRAIGSPALEDPARASVAAAVTAFPRHAIAKSGDVRGNWTAQQTVGFLSLPEGESQNGQFGLFLIEDSGDDLRLS
jgi:hypothetical protein